MQQRSASMIPGDRGMWLIFVMTVVLAISMLTTLAAATHFDWEEAEDMLATDTFRSLVTEATTKQVALRRNCPDLPLLCPDGAVMLLAPAKFARFRRNKCQRAGCAQDHVSYTATSQITDADEATKTTLEIASAIVGELTLLDQKDRTYARFSRHLSKKAAALLKEERNIIRNFKRALAVKDFVALRSHVHDVEGMGLYSEHLNDARRAIHEEDSKQMLESAMRTARTDGDLSALQQAVDRETESPLVHDLVTDAYRLLNSMKSEEERDFVALERAKAKALIKRKDKEILRLSSEVENLVVRTKECLSSLKKTRMQLAEQQKLNVQAIDTMQQAKEATDRLSALNLQLDAKNDKLVADRQVLIDALESAHARYDSLSSDQRVMAETMARLQAQKEAKRDVEQPIISFDTGD